MLRKLRRDAIATVREKWKCNYQESILILSTNLNELVNLIE